MKVKRHFECKAPYFGVRVWNSQTGEIETLIDFKRKGFNYSDWSDRLVSKFQVGCGKCIACRLKKSKDWAVRMMHESMLYENNRFVTLTYAPEFLPKDGSIDVRTPQLFFKRLRQDLYRDWLRKSRFFDGSLKRAEKKYKEYIYHETGFDSYFSLLKYYHFEYAKLPKALEKPPFIKAYYVGEYGEKMGRPHYHCIIFNFKFPDEKAPSRLKRNIGGKWIQLFTSEMAKKAWPYGFVDITSVGYECCAYVARYVMKKIYNGDSSDHYGTKLPEFNNMSRMHGLGYAFWQKFKSDIKRDGYVLVRKSLDKDSFFKLPIPMYYRELWKEEDPCGYLDFCQKNQELLSREMLDNSSIMSNNALVYGEQMEKIFREHVDPKLNRSFETDKESKNEKLHLYR